MVLEDSTIDRLLKKKNKRMSKETRDLLKMGLSQGTIRVVADGVFAKYGLPVIGVSPHGTSSVCPVCGLKLQEPKYGTKEWGGWKRDKKCVRCLYYMDRDDVASINILCRGISTYYIGGGLSESWTWVAGDWM